MKIDEILWKFVLTIQRMRGGQQITDAIIDSPLGRIYNDFLYAKDVKNPTKEMIAARDYFNNNVERIGRMASCLADKESKEVLKRVIAYRQSHDRKDRPLFSRKDQYFPKGIIDLEKEYVFVDCGAYNGDTIRAFLKYSDNRYKKIIAFEADINNVKQLKRNYRDVIAIYAAVWNENTVISFKNGSGSGSRIDENSADSVNAVKIDSVNECRDASFIKMDIEGAEYNALLGAEKTIRNNRPILAICIYHSDEDILRIFELINSWDLGYRFYIRHHAQKISETVLYALS